jgi:hypothetical protein
MESRTIDPPETLEAAMPVYIFLDTNIYIRYLMQSKPGCDPQFFQELKQLIDDGKARLLLPEIVLLELEKFWGRMETTLDDKFKEMKAGLEAYFKGQAGKSWNELSDVKDTMLKALDEKKRHKIETAQQHYQHIQDLFGSKHVESIPFGQEIWLRGKRRLIAGKMPYKEDEAGGEKKPDKQDRENDACIVESLHSYFQKNTQQGVLYFCSADVKDFGHGERDSIYLDATIREGLPKAPYFTDLKGLVEFANNPQEIKEPTPEEEKKDIEKEKQEAILRQQADQLTWLRPRPAPVIEEEYDPAYYQRRQFPWGALYPIPPFPALVMPQDEVLAFGTPQAIITHGPPPNPPPPGPVVAKPPDETIALETPPPFTTHGPPPNPPTEPGPEKTEPTESP